MKLSILGISGTNGSGKDTVGEMLAERHGWLFISVSQILRDELAKAGMPQDRHHTHRLSTRWRRESGMGVMIDKAVDRFKATKGDYKGLAISSLRHPGEAEAVHRLGGKIIWIDADIHVRYARAQSRRHGRAEDDQSFADFVADEQHQMNHSGDEATLNMLAVKQKADIFIDNSGDDLEEFIKKVEQKLGL
jgi:dephospho-CoA kinase